MLTDFLLGFGAGIAATPHCLGMCGGFPLHLARPGSRGSAALRQVLFVAGKCFTYMFLGTLAAALGVVLLRDTRLAGAGPALRVAAGAITIFFGLLMVGVRWPFHHGSTEGGKHGREGTPDRESAKGRKRGRGEREGLGVSFLGGLVSAPGYASAFVLGLGVGFLPCPLPMGMLAAAAAMHSVPHGISLMAGVGLGTAPGLLAVGLFGMGLDWKLKRAGMRVAGLVVIAIGLLTIYRAMGSMPRSHIVDSVVPPCCQEQQAK